MTDSWRPVLVRPVAAQSTISKGPDQQRFPKPCASFERLLTEAHTTCQWRIRYVLQADAMTRITLEDLENLYPGTLCPQPYAAWGR